MTGCSKPAAVICAILLFALIKGSDAIQCHLTDVRIPLVQGDWKPGARPKYNEHDCPDFVHLSACLRQSANLSKPLIEYDQHFESDGCTLREWNAESFLACMKEQGKRRIILIGDSMQWSFFEAWACLLHKHLDR